MPISNTAKRSLRKSLKNREANNLKKEALRQTEKQFFKLLASNNLEEAQKTLNVLYKLLDKAAKTNLIKKNTAARNKSRLAKKIVVPSK
ncbi:MAG: 30S ribosomal protein S20 [Minisyncoccia bacterium]